MGSFADLKGYFQSLGNKQVRVVFPHFGCREASLNNRCKFIETSYPFCNFLVLINFRDNVDAQAEEVAA